MALKSTQRNNIYSGPASSKDYNQFNEDVRFDMANMFQQLNDNEKAIHHNMDIVLRENFFLMNQLQKVNEELIRVQQLIENSEEDGPEGIRNRYQQTFYLTEGLQNVSDNQAAFIDRTHGVATPLPVNSLSRFGYQTDSGEVFIPNQLALQLKEGDDIRLDENGQPILSSVTLENSEAIIDKDKNTFWTRTVKYKTSQSVTEVFGELHIKIPTEGFQNIFANTLTIHPYPEGSMRIRDIQTKGYGDQWSRLSTYPTTMVNSIETPDVLENARKLIFHFPNTEVIEVKISFSQPYWFEHEQESHFTYGFQDIGLEYRSYTEKECSFVTEISLKSKNARFRLIENPVATAAPGAEVDLTDMVSYELYYDKQLTTPFDFGYRILSEVDTVYVKTILKKQHQSIPVIQRIEIPYLYEPK